MTSPAMRYSTRGMRQLSFHFGFRRMATVARSCRLHASMAVESLLVQGRDSGPVIEHADRASSAPELDSESSLCVAHGRSCQRDATSTIARRKKLADRWT